MTHHQDKDHHHHHSHQPEETLSFKAKMDKLLSHWIQHNDDHAANYRRWADQASGEKMPVIAAKLEEAARLTDQITRIFEEAARTL